MEWLCTTDGSDTFWSWNLTWHTNEPDLTACFQNTVLVWIPCIYLWLCFPFYYLYLRHHDNGYIRMSHLNKSKMVLGLLLVLLCFTDFFYSIWKMIHRGPQPPFFIVSSALLAVTMILATGLIQCERIHGVRSSGILFIFWLLEVLCALVPFRSKILAALKEDAAVDTFHYIIFYTYYALLLTMLVMACFTDKPPFFSNAHADEKNPCPEPNASFFSKVTFWWFTRIAIKGYKSPLKDEDLWSLKKVDTSENIVPKMMEAWEKEWARVKTKSSQMNYVRDKTMNGPKDMTNENKEVKVLLTGTEKQKIPSLFKVLCKVFGPYYLLGSLFILIFNICLFANPQILGLIVRFLKDPDVPPWHGFLYAATLFISALLQACLFHYHDYICYVTGMRIKTAIMGMAYRKALAITNSVRKTYSVGEIVTLISADLQKLMDFTVCANYLWCGPLIVVIGMYFLWKNFGPSVLAGVGSFIFIIPFIIWTGFHQKKIQNKQVKQMEKRINIMSEILNGIKVLKLYAWENAFMEKVLGIRTYELKAIKQFGVMYSVSLTLFLFSPFLISLAIFAVYVLSDETNVLDAEKAFVSISLLNVMRIPLRYLPQSISSASQASVALKRLSKFLSGEELTAESVDRIVASSSDNIIVENGTFSWSRLDSPCLTSINIKIRRGSLVAVVGHVGCGKSSLLSALLGEMEKEEGYVAVKGSIAYVSQQAWIQNATVKENIIFGQELNKSWYNSVVEACALLPDFEILAAGDQTEIGEKGINLSGGQKQRISLARAVYRQAALYLLDDPLSAVDAHVGQHIFEKVFGPNGLLKDKTRVLVTHSIGYLSQMDKVLVMSKGQITETGSYQELLMQDGAFAEFVRTYANAEQKEDSDDKEKEKDKSNEEIADQPPTQDQKEKLNTGKLTEADVARTGKVKLSVYKDFLKMMGVFLFIVSALFYISQQSASFGYNYWLTLWVEDPVVNGTQQNSDVRVTVYAFLGIIQATGSFFAALLTTIGCVIVSRTLHFKLLINVLRCPLSFFERTPTGNLLNRFAKELETIDNIIPKTLVVCITTFVVISEIFVIIAVASPMAIAVFIPVFLLYFFVQRFYVATSRQLKRIESVSKSPVYTHFNETLQGVNIIRAFGETERFIQRCDFVVNENQRSFYLSFVANRWLSQRLDFLTSFILLSAAFFAVIAKNHISPGLAALAITHALRLTGALNAAVNMITELETNIVAAERIREYCETENEAPWNTEYDSLSSTWPSNGRVEFENYGLRYRKDRELALKNINVTIFGGEKIGIVGRTGAGKSSLTLALFRIIEAAEGKIYIDGINIAQLGLHALRSKLTIIPQDPVLFSGSLRMNLDPFDKYSDGQIWQALKLAHLQNFVSSLPEKLHHKCSEGGENLSVGQRQLLCLARALLQKARILVLDEATAAVDLETDNLIQSTIRTQFDFCTVITIAHRINTIMDYERIIVLDNGQVVEFDTPANLQRSEGMFYSMVKDSGLL
ncbi:multidrug resistance-associated protein 1-like [Protopterus annectens]|uniref:multidrug resistance-associated protein 1-like n=1 Tax=Protopterus annectens TaxID=7888 RepID=UPI001CFBAEB2|nr:multidrug resistance-associated protein 1-like [Protopterus annectens]